ncbi:hypothetical protein BJ546DRAFT_516249 [Cryomyces antarcticus]
MALLPSLLLSRLALVFLPLLSLPETCSATCWTPNGTDRNAMFNATATYQFYAPCFTSLAEPNKVSMCCNVNGDGDQCNTTQAGLCYNPGSGRYWRESCTDRTWQDPACIKLFLNGTEGPNAKVSDVVVHRCDDGSWCYGDRQPTNDCCEAGEVYFIVNGTQTRTNPNSTISSSAIPSSPTSSSVVTGTSTPVPNPGPSSGVGIGVGVGVGVGVLALAVAAAIILFCIRKRRKRDRTQVRHAEDIPAYQDPQELSSYRKPRELSSSPLHQLPGSESISPVEMEQPGSYHDYHCENLLGSPGK